MATNAKFRRRATSDHTHRDLEVSLRMMSKVFSALLLRVTISENGADLKQK